MKKQRIVICGATGFIGKNILLYFSKKTQFEVIGLYNKRPKFKLKNIKWKKINLKNSNKIKNIFKKNDIVFQAAATTSGSKDIINKPYYHVTDNAIMNSIVLRETFEKKIKHLIFFSCSVMYNPRLKKVKETDFNLNDAVHDKYFGVGWTKIYIEKMCEFYSNISNIKYSVIRHSNIYGPHDKFDLKKSHFFGASITKILTSKTRQIEIWGNGKEKRDLLYIQDLIDLLNIIIRKQKTNYELVNIGYGKAFSVEAIVKKIIKLSNRKLKIIKNLSKPSIDFNLSLNSAKAKKIYGWYPKVSIESGILKTIDWYKKNKG